MPTWNSEPGTEEGGCVIIYLAFCCDISSQEGSVLYYQSTSHSLDPRG